MVPFALLPRARAFGAALERLPALHPAVQGCTLLAAALVGAALAASAWLAAAIGAVSLLAAAVAGLYLRGLQRELGAARRARADWERRYYRLHDSMAVGIFRADAHGRLTGANRGLCSLLGYRSETELISLDFAQQAYVGPGTFEAVLQRARVQGALENLELRLRRFDGLTVTALATVQAIWDEAGDVAAFDGTLVDLTRERLAESQRRSMERRFRRLFDASAVGMLIGNLRRGTLEEANPALIEMFGLRPSELPVPLEKVIPADQRRLHRGVRAALETNGIAGPLVVEYVGADGARIPVMLSAAMVEPQHGEFVAVLADRSAEARAGRLAAQLQAFHEALLEDAPTPVAIFDGGRHLVHANPALAALLAVAGPVREEAFADLVGPTSPAAASTAVAKALAGEMAYLDVGFQRGSNRLALHVTLVPRCSAGVESTGFLAFVHDGSIMDGRKAATTTGTSVAGRPGVECVTGRRSA